MEIVFLDGEDDIVQNKIVSDDGKHFIGFKCVDDFDTFERISLLGRAAYHQVVVDVFFEGFIFVDIGFFFIADDVFLRFEFKDLDAVIGFHRFVYPLRIDEDAVGVGLFGDDFGVEGFFVKFDDDLIAEHHA